eukprot:261422_1
MLVVLFTLLCITDGIVTPSPTMSGDTEWGEISRRSSELPIDTEPMAPIELDTKKGKKRKKGRKHREQHEIAHGYIKPPMKRKSRKLFLPKAITRAGAEKKRQKELDEYLTTDPKKTKEWEDAYERNLFEKLLRKEEEKIVEKARKKAEKKRKRAAKKRDKQRRIEEIEMEERKVAEHEARLAALLGPATSSASARMIDANTASYYEIYDTDNLVPYWIKDKVKYLRKKQKASNTAHEIFESLLSDYLYYGYNGYDNYYDYGQYDEAISETIDEIEQAAHVNRLINGYQNY